MFSAIAKTYYAEKAGIDPEKIYTVSIMPCTAKKFERERQEMNDSGYKDTDAVLTTREIATMIKEIGLNFNHLQDEEYDEMLGKATGAGTIFGTTGGVAEAAVRTVKEKLTGEELDRLNLGFRGVNEAEVEIGDRVVKVAIANGLSKAADLLDEVRAGESDYDFIEIMACPHGCVGGGGQPLPADKKIKDKRGEGLANIDEAKFIRKSHENPMIKKLYDEFLGNPLSEKSKRLLHTEFQERPKN